MHRPLCRYRLADRDSQPTGAPPGAAAGSLTGTRGASRSPTGHCGQLVEELPPSLAVSGGFGVG